MFDFDVFDSDRNKRNLGHVIGNDTAVLCHAVYPYGELPYYRYLSGLDCRIVTVASSDSPLLHMVPFTHNIHIETYTDPELSVLSSLKQEWSLTDHPKLLVKKLRFQILLHKGQIVKHWMQPLRNHWDDFLGDSKFFKRFYQQFGFYGVEWLRKQNRNSSWIWDTAVPVWEYTEMGNPNLDLFFKHYRLMPNEDLEQKIKTLKG